MSGGGSPRESMTDTEQIVSQVRELSRTIENPDLWRVLIPTDSFESVKGQLDTEYDAGTYYNGITLCYTPHHDEPRVEYKSNLSDHLAEGDSCRISTSLQRLDERFLSNLYISVTGDGSETDADEAREYLRSEFSDGEIESIVRSYLLCLSVPETVRRVGMGGDQP